MAEMLCGGRGVGRYGATVDLTQVGTSRGQKLFSETGGFVVEVKDAEALPSSPSGYFSSVK